ncbi:hypothetical protein PG994_007422 [Apiospora phragmitis]|uniref:Haloacid dehalogenase n=1 Tax=Apiospora phragmitis TaxID=2905665 RepID=A0ABR1V0R6_9PEZI
MASEPRKVPDLTGCKALSFDCYGTLIDWKRGFSAPLHAITSQLPPGHPYRSQQGEEERPVLALREDLGVERKDEVLHVAHSISVDHVPARQMGLRSGGGGGWRDGTHGDEAAEYKDRAAYEWQFDTIEQLADEAERQFASKENVK